MPGTPDTGARPTDIRNIACQWRALTCTVGALAAGTAVATAAGPAGPGQARTGGSPAFRTLTRWGRTFQLPRSWPIISLARHPRTCVRFDRHAVYVGTPGRDEACPARLIGTTQALLIRRLPGRTARSARTSVRNPVDRLITVQAGGVEVIATYGADPGQIDRILASASLPEPVVGQAGRPQGLPGDPPQEAASGLPAATPAAATLPAATLPAWVTNYHGFGFDACTAPSYPAMRAWRKHSRYRAVGIFIGGADRSCAQPNLTRRWLRVQARSGWRFIPLYAGLQAEFGQLRRPARQGTAAAADAVAQARRLGFRQHTVIYYDMEGYPPGKSAAALRFFSAWTIRVHRLGYASGIYSSANSGIADLARAYYCRAMPDVIYIGRWDGRPRTADPVIRRGEWTGHRRLHQYAGNIDQSFGGYPIMIDQDYLDVRLPSRWRPPLPGTSGRHHCSR